MTAHKKLPHLTWRTVHIGSGKNKRYMKVAVQRGTKRTVVGKPRKRRS